MDKKKMTQRVGKYVVIVGALFLVLVTEMLFLRGVSLAAVADPGGGAPTSPPKPATIIPITSNPAGAQGPVKVKVQYNSTDEKCPLASEYTAAVAAQKPAYRKEPVDFFTLCGVVKTVKSVEQELKNKNGQDLGKFYYVGEAAPNYLIVVYNHLCRMFRTFCKPIAVTTTNGNGKFAIPIEKDGAGKFVVVYEQSAGGPLRMVTAYEVLNRKTERGSGTPEAGLSIGVPKLSDGEGTATTIEIPEKPYFYEMRGYWSCGGEAKVTFDDISIQTNVKIPITDKDYRGQQVGAGDVPTQSSYPVKGKVEGRQLWERYSSMRNSASTENFLRSSGEHLPEGSNVLPSCSVFFGNKQITTGSPDINSYKSGGLLNMSLPGMLAIRTEKGEVVSSTLTRTPACLEENGATMYYSEAAKEGAGPNVSKDFVANISANTQYLGTLQLNKAEKDAGTNIGKDGKERGDDAPRVLPFPRETAEGRGNQPYVGGYTYLQPLEIETVNGFTETFSDNAPFKAFSVPGMEVETTTPWIYELGQQKPLCWVSEVKNAAGNKLNIGSKNNTEAWDSIEEGYTLTRNTNVKFFGDTLTNGFLDSVTNLVAVFSGWLTGNGPDGDKSCFVVTKDIEASGLEKCNDNGIEGACEEVVDKKGNKSYNKHVVIYNCDGNGNFNMGSTSKPDKDENNKVNIKGSALDNALNLSKTFTLPGTEKPLAIGRKNLATLHATYSLGSDKDPIKEWGIAKQLEFYSGSNEVSTETLDYARFLNKLPYKRGSKGSYKEVLITLIDKEFTGEEAEDILYAGSLGGGGYGPKPAPLENPGSCPVCVGFKTILTYSYSTPNVYQHGSNEYWRRQSSKPSDPAVWPKEACKYGVPMISPSGERGTMGPTPAVNKDNNLCVNKTPLADDYGFALDLRAGIPSGTADPCYDKLQNIYAPTFKELKEWKVVAMRRPGGDFGRLQGFVDIEGLTSEGKVFLRLYHLDVFYVETGDTIKPGDPIAKYAVWNTDEPYEPADNSHTHVEMKVNGKTVPPEDNLTCSN